MPREIIKTGGPGKAIADIRRTTIVVALAVAAISLIFWLVTHAGH
jgi:hypothetical protein